MNWITYQGVVENGRVMLPPSARLPEKATVLVTVLDDLSRWMHSDKRSDLDRARQAALLDEARQLRALLKAENRTTDSQAALEETREDRSNELMDLR